jgi:methylmalonyl-CoA mutase
MGFYNAFEDSTKAEWLEKIEVDLKGKTIKSLDWSLFDDLLISPFAHRDDLKERREPQISHKEQNDWLIAEDFWVDDVFSANKAALAGLSHGLQLVRFFVDKDFQEIAALLEGISVNFIEVHFLLKDGSSQFNPSLIEKVSRYIKANQINKGRILVFGVDSSPTVDIAGIRGLMPANQSLIKITKKNFDGVANLMLNFERLLSQLVTATKLEQEQSIWINIKIGKSYLLSIAKIRAIKILAANILSAHDLESTVRPRFLVSFKSYPQGNSQYDNLIQSGLQAMSAVIGGCDALIIHPVSSDNRSTARRLARNQQHLLKMESSLDRCIDPSAGSYYIEKLTDLIATKAWEKLST